MANIKKVSVCVHVFSMSLTMNSDEPPVAGWSLYWRRVVFSVRCELNFLYIFQINLMLYIVNKAGNVRINVTLRHVRGTIVAVEKQ